MSDDENSTPEKALAPQEIFKRYLKGFPLIFIQSNGTVIQLNEIATQLLGCGPEEWTGQNVNILFQFLGIAIKDFNQNAVFEALVNRSDFSVFPAQVHVIFIEKNLSMMILSDLSLRNRLRDQLIQEKNLLTTMLDAIQDHVFIVDSQGQYLLNNKSHLEFLGVKTQEEVLGRFATQFFDGSLAESFLEDNQQILTGSQDSLNRTTEVSPGQWYEIKKTSLKDPTTKRVTGVVGVARDVTERIQTEDRLRQVQRLESLGLLAGGIAHDFNNLLTVVVGLADTASLMMDSVRPDQPIRRDEIQDLKETLSEIKQAGQRAASLTQKLLAVGRQQLVEMKPLALNDIIRGMSSVLSGILKSVEKPISIARLDHRLMVNLPLIRGDRSQLEQVLLNLLVNARDAIANRIEENGDQEYIPVVLLRTFYDESHKKVYFEVKDNGCGMPDEVKAKVFDPFFTTKGVGRGTGLGLASVYGILQQSDATIQINSELGVGTTFLIGFPEWRESDEAASGKADESVEKKVNRRILYVEDDVVIRTLVRRNLQIQGFEVAEAEDGAIAWEIYQKSPENFSLILTDLLMPRMSGVELCRKIQEINPAQAILCVSGYSNEDTGGLPVLNKPFTIQKLSQRIEELLVG